MEVGIPQQRAQMSLELLSNSTYINTKIHILKRVTYSERKRYLPRSALASIKDALTFNLCTIAKSFASYQ